MRIEEAIAVLHRYQKWRRDSHVPNRYPMPAPERIGMAIDCAIHHLRTCVQVDRVIEAYDELDKSIKETKPF